ncbi:MAG: hypothetical protein JSV52_11370 [Candidatus Zixiibacteriota bacterium]|nr:MAG: hypothetical protein JSV52_11370 [candidate division Zixibacteria bacterium]
MINRNRVAFLLVCVMAVLLFSQSVSAQAYWLRPADEKSVSLDFFKAAFDEAEGLNFFTSMIYLSAYIPATPELAVIFDFPMSNVDTDFEDQSVFGNPYLGIEYVAPVSGGNQSIKGRLGFRPPLASDSKFAASLLGMVSMIDRFESFVPDLWTLSGGFGFQFKSEAEYGFDIDFTGDLMMPTEGGAENELYVDYSMVMWFRPEKANLGFGLAGRLLATEGDMDFGERTVHQLGFFGGYDAGVFEPGFHFRVPLDEDLSDVLDFLWGINLTVTFP